MSVINNKLPKIRSFDIKFGDVNFDPKKVNQMIEDHGVRIRLYKSMICPNVKSVDGAEHNIDCKICDNSFIDLDPIETNAFFGNLTKAKDYKVEGAYDDMTVQATFFSGMDVNYFAKIELLDYTTQFFELVQRQEGEEDKLRYPAVKVNVLVDRSGKRYYQGSDFDLSPNLNVLWRDGGARPAFKEPYSIHYDYHITYRAVQATHINRFVNYIRKQDYKTPIQMPQQWLLKRDFHISRDNLDGEEMQKNKVFDYDTL